MISKILVIVQGGVLAYYKTFIGVDNVDYDLVSGFLTAISNIAKEIGGGEIRSLNFGNFNYVYTYDDEKLGMYIIVTDIDDAEEEARDKLELLKTEFLKRYYNDIKDWSCETRKFEAFDEFAEKNIFIPPKILLVGELGVGKSTLVNLYPGEVILELDDDLNEIIQKTIQFPQLKIINAMNLREMDMKDLVDNSKIYRPLLDSVDIICVVTNSGASNLGRTKRLLSILEQKVKKAEYYIIANFQDLKNTSYEPGKVEEFFGIKTYGMSAISEKAKDEMDSMLMEMVTSSIIGKTFSNKT